MFKLIRTGKRDAGPHHEPAQGKLSPVSGSTAVFLLCLTWIAAAGTMRADSLMAQEDSQLVDQGHALHSSFQDFAHARIKLLNRNYLHTPDNLDLMSRGGCFVASYSRVDQGSIHTVVKKTGSLKTRYIGVLCYTESVYESTEQCDREEVKGPFSPVTRRRITEIFRYADQSWR
ncbi:MAG: hypothetical protein ACOCPN_01100 [Desulfonatronovibrionaceae bacterium]